MKIAILFGSPKISGGSYVIFQHAAYLITKGHSVDLVTLQPISLKPQDMWHDAMRELNFVDVGIAEKKEYDIALATWWLSPFHLPRLNAKQYAYFVQSIEAYFSEDADIASQYLAHASYALGLPVITEALWIKQDLETRFHSDVFFVENGIRKDIYKPQGPALAPRPTSGIRFLIEGAVTSRFKNVARTVDAVRAAGSHEIWLLTPSPIASYPMVDKVISNVPIHEVPKIYRSCDALIKHSTVEGMFGPPLEMFHCGGTAVVSDVTGYDQYIQNERNALVTSTGNWYQITEAIRRLADDPGLVSRLKEGALETANQWPDWRRQSALFEAAIMEIYGLQQVSRERLAVDTQHCLNLNSLIRNSLAQNYERKELTLRLRDAPDLNSLAGGERYYHEELSRPFALPTRITKGPSIDRTIWHPATQSVTPAAMTIGAVGALRKSRPRIFGFSISNEHIEELWHPIVTRLGWEARYMCSRPKGHFSLFELEQPRVQDDDYIVQDWIGSPATLFQQIETYRPDLILFHNGNHPAYQHVLNELAQRFKTPVAYSELGWFPQKEHVHFDPWGTNGASLLCAQSLEELSGRTFDAEAQQAPLVSNIVVLALQLENDTNSIVFSPYFRSNRDLIETVLREVPGEFEVLVKPHPLDHTAHRYDKFLDHRSQIVSEPMSELLANAGGVIAINSTVLLEALGYPINIYACGISVLSHKGIAIDFDKADRSLRSVWRDTFVNNAERREALTTALKGYQFNLASLQTIDDEALLSNPSIKVLTSLLENESGKSIFPARRPRPIAAGELPTRAGGKRHLVRSTKEIMAIMSAYDAISFDVFDTMLVRDIYAPQDLFALVGRDVARLVNDSKFNHRAARIEAERAARRAAPGGEVSLNDIYIHYLLATGIAADVVEAIKQAEIEAELKFLRARENTLALFNFARELGRRVVVTSDFYLSEELLRRALKENGYDLENVKVFLSSSHNLTKHHGALFDFVAEALGLEPNRILHIGDNFVADTTNGVARGYHVVHVPSPRTSLDIAPMLKKYLDGRTGNLVEKRTLEWSIMLGILNNGLFDDHFAVDLKTAFGKNYHRFGYTVLGPLLTSFTSWLRRQTVEKKIDILLFLARDGWVMEKAFKRYEGIVPSDSGVRIAYIAASRRLMDLIALNQSFDNISRIVNARYSKGALGAFLKLRLDLDPAEVPARALGTAGYKDFDEPVTLPQDRVRVMKLLQALRNEIKAKASALEKQYLDHLQEKGVRPGDRVAVVDIGYFGTMQKSIDALLRENRCIVEGFYMAVRSEAHLEPELKGRLSGYLSNGFDPSDGRSPAFMEKFALLEQIFSAPHASVLAVRNGEAGTAIEYLLATGEEAQWAQLDQIHAGALDYVERAASLEARLGSPVRFDSVNHALHLDNLFLAHSAELADLLSGFVFENRFNGEGISLLAKTLLTPPPPSKATASNEAPSPKPAEALARKPVPTAPAKKPAPAASAVEQPKDLRPSLKLAVNSVRRDDNVIEIAKGVAGHGVYGPYLKLGAGGYRVSVALETEAARLFMKPKGAVVIDIATNEGNEILAERKVDISSIKNGFSRHVIDFQVPTGRVNVPIEFRIWTDGRHRTLVREVVLSRL